MTVKQIIEEYLQEHGYDGLCCPEIECGCGFDDLIPCGEECEMCEPAYLHQHDKKCPACRGRGCYYTEKPDWPKDLSPELVKHFEDAKNWVCECGERCNPAGTNWRWSGTAWEHYHGYPIGHVPAEREG